MLTALSSQLSDWGCQVIEAKNMATTVQQLEQYFNQQQAQSNNIPKLIIADYHLGNDENGVDLIRKLLAERSWTIPCVICSADPSERVRQHTSDAQFYFLRKPVKALALKRLLKQLLD